MTYSKYHTHAIILESYEHGESDRMFMMLTETHGLIRVVAQSVRNEKSKLRGALQPLSDIRVGVLRARDGWRLTDAKIESPPMTVLPPYAQQMLVRIGSLVRRLVDVDEPVTDVFHILHNGVRFVHAAHLSEHDCGTVETILAMRVLHRLGYFGGGGYFDHIIASPYINDMIVTEAARLQARIVPHINRSMKEIQL